MEVTIKLPHKIIVKKFSIAIISFSIYNTLKLQLRQNIIILVDLYAVHSVLNFS